jgi:hypothetical protein
MPTKWKWLLIACVAALCRALLVRHSLLRTRGLGRTRIDWFLAGDLHFNIHDLLKCDAGLFPHQLHQVR